jgi:hypothetical protein
MNRTLRCGNLLLVLAMIGSASMAFAHPGAAIAVTADGRVFFVDTGRGIYEIGQDGRLRRHQGPAFHWFALDSASHFVKTKWPAFPDAEIQSLGRNPTLVLSSDFPVAIGADGAFYLPERNSQNRWRIIRLTSSGSRSIHATLPADIRPSGSSGWINGLAPGPGGSLYYTHERTVRKINNRGVVTTVAANVQVPNCATIPGVEPEIRPYLRGLAVAPDGHVFVAAAGCGAVLRISPSGQVTPVLRTTSPYSPTAVALSNGEVFVLEYLHTASDDRREWFARVRKGRRNGTVVTLVDMKR